MTNKYQRQIRRETIDVYDILDAFQVTNPGCQHAIKKLLMPGQRGSKTVLEDLCEAQQAIDRAICLERSRGNAPIA